MHTFATVKILLFHRSPKHRMHQRSYEVKLCNLDCANGLYYVQFDYFKSFITQPSETDTAKSYTADSKFRQMYQQMDEQCFARL